MNWNNTTKFLKMQFLASISILSERLTIILMKFVCKSQQMNSKISSLTQMQRDMRICFRRQMKRWSKLKRVMKVGRVMTAMMKRTNGASVKMKTLITIFLLKEIHSFYKTKTMKVFLLETTLNTGMNSLL